MSQFYDDFEDEMDDVVQEAIESEKVVKKVKRERINFDFLFAVVGICLAGSAAFLPWYVFLHQEDFSVKRMSYTKDRELPDWEGRTIVNVSPSAIPKRDPEALDEDLLPDDITTASIPENGGDGGDGSQAFPGQPRFKLLHVANERALIEDASGMYMVKVGSVLPDNSTLSALEQRGNSWALVTSNGDVVEN